MFKGIKRWKQYINIARAADKTLDEVERRQRMGKEFWKSKTFWVNILALINELLKIVPLNPSIENAVPLIPTEVIVASLPIANILLRRVTNEPMKFSLNLNKDYARRDW